MINRQKDTIYIERWEGVFFYPVDDENYDIPKRVNFHINVEIKNDIFIGTHSDEESAPIFEEDAKLKGYFEDNFLSFILKYPYLYFLDEFGQQKTDKNKNHPKIHYYGNFNQKTNSYLGAWEMFEEFNDEFGSPWIERTEGAWEFKVTSSKVK